VASQQQGMLSFDDLLRMRNMSEALEAQPKYAKDLKPPVITVEKSGASAIQIVLLVPKTEEISDSQVQYKTTSEGAKWSLFKPVGNQASHIVIVIGPLQPSTQYTFRARVKNTKGWGGWSDGKLVGKTSPALFECRQKPSLKAEVTVNAGSCGGFVSAAMLVGNSWPLSSAHFIWHADGGSDGALMTAPMKDPTPQNDTMWSRECLCESSSSLASVYSNALREYAHTLTSCMLTTPADLSTTRLINKTHTTLQKRVASRQKAFTHATAALPALAKGVQRLAAQVTMEQQSIDEKKAPKSVNPNVIGHLTTAMKKSEEALDATSAGFGNVSMSCGNGTAKRGPLALVDIQKKWSCASDVSAKADIIVYAVAGEPFIELRTRVHDQSVLGTRCKQALVAESTKTYAAGLKQYASLLDMCSGNMKAGGNAQPKSSAAMALGFKRNWSPDAELTFAVSDVADMAKENVEASFQSSFQVQMSGVADLQAEKEKFEQLEETTSADKAHLEQMADSVSTMVQDGEADVHAMMSAVVEAEKLSEQALSAVEDDAPLIDVYECTIDSNQYGSFTHSNPLVCSPSLMWTAQAEAELTPFCNKEFMVEGSRRYGNLLKKYSSSQEKCSDVTHSGNAESRKLVKQLNKAAKADLHATGGTLANASAVTEALQDSVDELTAGSTVLDVTCQGSALAEKVAQDVSRAKVALSSMLASVSAANEENKKEYEKKVANPPFPAKDSLQVCGSTVEVDAGALPAGAGLSTGMVAKSAECAKEFQKAAVSKFGNNLGKLSEAVSSCPVGGSCQFTPANKSAAAEATRELMKKKELQRQALKAGLTNKELAHKKRLNDLTVYATETSQMKSQVSDIEDKLLPEGTASKLAKPPVGKDDGPEYPMPFPEDDAEGSEMRVVNFDTTFCTKRMDRDHRLMQQAAKREDAQAHEWVTAVQSNVEVLHQILKHQIS